MNKASCYWALYAYKQNYYEDISIQQGTCFGQTKNATNHKLSRGVAGALVWGGVCDGPTCWQPQCHTWRLLCTTVPRHYALCNMHYGATALRCHCTTAWCHCTTAWCHCCIMSLHHGTIALRCHFTMVPLHSGASVLFGAPYRTRSSSEASAWPVHSMALQCRVCTGLQKIFFVRKR